MTQGIPRIIGRALSALVVSVVLSRGVAHAGQAFLFDFESDASFGTFTTTNNGASATFSSSGDMFCVIPSSAMFLTLTGNVLFQGFPTDKTLNILFDQDIEYVQLLFGSTAVGQMTLTALAQNFSHVGQTTASSNFLPDSLIAEGTIAFGGSAFRSLDLTFTSSDEDATFAIDDVTNSPEPATLFLMSLGAIALGYTQKRLRARP